MINLMRGDCLERMKEIESGSVDLVLVDPPYDIKNTKAGGKSKLAKSMQVMNDQIREANIVNGFDELILDELVRVNKNINMYIFCNKAQLPMYMKYFVMERGCSFDLIKWVKTNAMPTYNNKYLSDTEYCFYARKRGYCNPENYSDASTLYSAPINIKDKKKFNHPTIKPIPLLERLIRNSSKEGDNILDCFMGSGSTGVAAKNLNRNFIGIELDENYFNIAKERIEKA
ncbi:adenine-specific DNA methyltransferase [Pseudoalteromonas phage H105/1]|uniref:DNA methyltransferase n=1 Tax=Pseudoalteromonas phage H105/1 TaxID=877240 RepID=UPI0001E439DC|nr:DNA methyltransferase [Pseudoalteromonas phage H105/1]ADM26685.1 adenine-specific DNA methyltransferase [Pseudoalteromonas phage H105/1]